MEGKDDESDIEKQMGSNTDGVDVKVGIESLDIHEEKVMKSRLAFAIDDRPPLHIAAFYGFQIIMTNLPFIVTAVFIISNAVCGGRDYELMAKLISSSILMAGIASFLQVLFGTRLPITQGSSYLFFPPIIAMMASERWKCPTDSPFASSNGTFSNISISSMIDMDTEPAWRPRIAQVSGGLIGASLIEVFLGLTGAVGFLMNYIGPLTLSPVVMLIGLSLFNFAVETSKHQWGIALLTVGLIVIFTTTLAEVKIPVINWNKAKGFHTARYPLLRIFSNFLAIGITWTLCHILTVTGCLPTDKDAVGYYARTDPKLDSLKKIPWFYIPHPGQFGLPTFGPDIFVGMLAATFGSILESIGDYHATARVCEIPKPPKHSINRGIAMEGIASVLSGLYGTCHGTTSYSNVMGFIAYSGVASRWAWVFMSFVLMTLAIIGKLAGALAAIPDPVLGGLMILGLGFCILCGMTQLHSVDLMATRNQISLALSLMLGMMVPKFVLDDPSVINTGSKDVDSVIHVFLSTAPFVGGIIGFVLDNVLPGTLAERGMAPEEHGSEEYEISPERYKEIFNFPFPTDWLETFKCFSYIPSLPCYKERRMPCACKRRSIFCRKVNDTDMNVTKSNPESDIKEFETSSFHTSL